MQNTRSLGTATNQRMYPAGCLLQSFGTEKYVCALPLVIIIIIIFFPSKYRVKLDPVFVMQISLEHFKCLHPGPRLRNDPEDTVDFEKIKNMIPIACYSTINT